MSINIGFRPPQARRHSYVVIVKKMSTFVKSIHETSHALLYTNRVKNRKKVPLYSRDFCTGRLLKS